MKKQELQRQQLGVTETEAEHMCGGEAGLKRALSRGDCRQDTDGFFVFRRRLVTDSESVSETNKVMAQQSATPEDVLNMAAGMHAEWSASLGFGVDNWGCVDVSFLVEARSKGVALQLRQECVGVFLFSFYLFFKTGF